MGRTTPRLRREQVVDRLRAACAGAGGQAAGGRQNGVSQQYVHDVLRGRRDPGDTVLRPLGLQRATVYVPREPETVALYDADGLTLIEAEVL
ncbi:hypothetical protein [Methylobacterium sp. NFXW15]|uniref:hypothetical protein n=1 Tax=Methylobacterium sp. NFXW15 TaxID=2819512 RepID=UPI003CE7EC60